MIRKLMLRSYTFDANSTPNQTTTPTTTPPLSQQSSMEQQQVENSTSSSQTRSYNRQPPWIRSSSQPAPWRQHNGEFREISDGNWTYCYDSESSGGLPIKGFGNVPIVSYEDIAKMSDRRLKVSSITWNMNEKSVKVLNYLAQKITENYENMDSDVIFICLQEIPSTAKTFHEEALKILEPVLKTHSLYLSHRAWSQMVIVFIRKQHLKYAIQPQVSFVSSGAMAKPVRTKGAIAVCLRLYQRWIVFIGCHLSHATSQARVQDYVKIVKTLRFASLKKFHATGNHDLFSSDVVFWTGDLNFRVTNDNQLDWKEFDKIDSETYDKVLEEEELATLRGKGIAFSEFAEPPIRFAPTHKFEPDTDNYVAKRIPSFTDRVLYWSRNPDWIQICKYDSLRGPCPSDHKPVYSTFWLTVINKPIPKKYYSADSKVSILKTNDSTNSLPVAHAPSIEED
ncbi:unnamed protein product [Caenorhabditis angaria]|uniref:Inositol polyphosphate-related phosphatase domain-containing protein n=1 Tax=Caenorhabditis angaria TaxID=860376 RepID=A0A9P1IP52_9PELO|nr:unnamed protein product [Caenorhabditis angaria]